MRSLHQQGTLAGRLLVLSVLTAGLVLAPGVRAETKGEAAGGLSFSRAPLPRLQPGIVVGEHQSAGYSDVVTMVLPRLASGHIDSLPDYSRRYASMFKFVVLANVVKKQSAAGTQHFLDKVGIGFTMDINGKMTVVTSETANQLGANLGMIDRGVLSGNEDCLKDIYQVARTNQLLIFDAKANMLVGDKHEERIMRYFLWVSSGSGRLGTLVWLLNDIEQTSHVVDSPNMQLLPPAFKEDRRIHVSKGGFLSSAIPSPEQFALESLPKGTPVPFSPAMKTIAGEKLMTREKLQTFVTAAGESIAQLKANQGTRRE